MKDRHFHLIGVGGIGMSGVARLLLQAGARVSGSDQGDVGHLQCLQQRGLNLFQTHKAQNLSDDVDEVVYSVAVPLDNPELEEASRRQLPICKYAQMVGRLMANKKGICVAGAHGKTSTSAMIAWILRQAGRDPSFIIGADVPQLEGSSYGGGDDFVLESCEYDRSFHNYFPDRAIVTNVDLDHLDYYQDIEEIQESFSQFCGQVKEVLYLNGDDVYSQNLKHDQSKTFGFGSANDLQVIPLENGQARLLLRGQAWLELRLEVPGRHNLLNAAASAWVAKDLGCSNEVIFQALGGFRGAARRFQVIHENEGYVVVDDYAHHPVEIKAVIDAAQERWPSHQRVIIFQPHQHSRTRFLLDAFAEVLSQAEFCLLPDIYFVRDSQTHQKDVSSQDLVQAIKKRGGEAKYLPNFDDLPTILEKLKKKPTVVLLLGAGDIWKLGETLCF